MPCNLFVATPTADGKVCREYTSSLLDLQLALHKEGGSLSLETTAGSASVAFIRNLLVHRFLSSECTHLAFIDSDSAFDATDIIKMVQFDLDVIAAPFVRREILWDRVKAVVQAMPNIAPEALHLFASRSNWNRLERDRGTPNVPLDVPLEVADASTGLMLIKRRVLDVMQKAYKDLYNILDDGTRIAAYFDTMTVDDHKWLSTDFAFCRRWRDIGGKVHMWLGCRTGHMGTYCFVADAPAMLERS